ncbi:gamma subclass chorismate mutase AroQ [Streptomyces sp. NPDC021093]|uniref:gamma subclass chorismate mutase AroQ n=1 Tax=Streptomyces sp. NPDC021093 TaxID=3365112 RepID=UPI0037A46AE5
MQQSSPTRRRLFAAVAAAAAVLSVGAGTAVAAPVSEAHASVSAAHASGPLGRLGPLADWSAQRLATADLVAAAKYGTDSPIDDPAREKVVLETVEQQAKESGADPVATVRIFRDQIEANKVVQRALHRRWDAHPAEAPAGRPDLGEVRKEINRINTGLVQGIRDSAQARGAAYCTPVTLLSAARVAHARHLDALHTRALARSLRTVCD